MLEVVQVLALRINLPWLVESWSFRQIRPADLTKVFGVNDIFNLMAIPGFRIRARKTHLNKMTCSMTHEK